MKTKKIKNLKQKIIIPIIVLLLFNFAMPNYSKADAGDVMDDIGGVLLEPICDILVAIGGKMLSIYQPKMDLFICKN